MGRKSNDIIQGQSPAEEERNVALERTSDMENITADEAARIYLAQELKVNIPELTESERAAAIAIMEAGAASMQTSISDYIQNTFPDGIFGDFSKTQDAAHQQGVEINGAVSVRGFGDSVKATIYAGKTADFSTWVHELSHVWQAQLSGKLKNDAEKAFQVKDGNWQKSIYTFEDGHTDTSAEAFAYGFEDFLKKKAGEMAAEDKKAIFEKFADYMARTYNGTKEHIKINENISKVYEQFVRLDDNILAQAEKAVQQEKEFNKNLSENERQRIAVRERYKDTDLWLKAPNGKISNLTEEQWVTVHTPNFKRWFGNWDYDENKKIEPVELNLASVEFNHNNAREVEKWMKENLSGKSVEVSSSGAKVLFFNKGLQDSLKRHGEIQRDSYSVMESLVENAELFDFVANDGKDKHKGILGQDIYYSALKVDDKYYSVQFKFNVSGKYFTDSYKDHKIAEIKIAPLPYRGSNNAHADTSAIHSFTISELTGGVKPEFSKVIDANGEPLVVYHGSPNSSFDVFDRNKIGTTTDYGLYGKGFYFSNQKPQAEMYGETTEVFLNIRKPLSIDDFNSPEQLANELDAYPEYFVMQNGRVKPSGSFTGFDLYLEAKNYDGVLVKQTESLNEIVSFKPNQIKSAANNNGNFDINNDSILFQLVGERSIMRMTQNEERKRLLEDLAAAKLMDEKYSNIEPSLKATRIRFATGWEKSADGQWKYELDDSLNRIKSGSLFEKILNTSPEMLEQLTKNTTLTLDDIMEAPELYGVFPFMKNVRVGFYSDPNAFRAVLTPDGIKINTKYLDGISGEKGMKGVLAHEIQHIIQAVEYSGSKGINGESIEQLYNNMMEAMKAASIKRYDYDVSSLEHGLSEYMHDSGEIEARNVARRIFMNASERRHTTLESTEDIARNMQFQIIGEQGAGELDRNTESNERIANLDTAKEMEKAEKDANAIRLATGWEKGADGKWKYEIDDSKVHFDLYSAMEEWDNEHTRYKELQKKFFETGLSDEEQEEFDKWIDERNYVQDKHTDLSFAEKLFGKNFRLPEVMNHPELFKAYPELKDVTVSIKEQNSPAKGDANYEDKHINLYRAKEDTGSFEDWEKEAGSVLLHEVQHIIQGIEGFAKGADLDTFTPGIEAPELTKALSGFRTYSKEKLKNFSAAKEYQQYKDLGLSDDEIKELRPNIYGLGTIEEIIERDIKDHGVDWVYDEIQSAAEVVDNEGIIKVNGKKYVNNFDAYRSAAGEVESRNVQTRQHFTQEQRLSTLLSDTADIASKDQIVMFDGPTSESRDIKNTNEERNVALKVGKQEKKMENPSSENISYENEEISESAAIKERNQQEKLTTQMILAQEDKEQMESISATMKSATKDFMDLNATSITEERTMKSTENFESQEYWKNQFQQENADTFKAIDDYLDKGIKPKNDEFIFEKVPEILKAANVSENEIVIKTSIINKAKNEHSLSDEEIKDSIKNIASPVLIFNSDKTTTENKKESFLSLTDTFAENGKPIAFSMNLDSDYERKNRLLEINEIRSIHDRTLIAKNGTDLIQKWTENGLCRYVDDKKISEWSKAAGVQFPLAVLQSDRNNILSESDFVNDKKISEWQLAARVQFPLAVLHSDSTRIHQSDGFVNEVLSFSKFADEQEQKEKEKGYRKWLSMSSSDEKQSVVQEDVSKEAGKDYEALKQYQQKYPVSTLDVSSDVKEQLNIVFEQINSYFDNGISPKDGRFILPEVPEYMANTGSDKTPISLPVAVIKKARDVHQLNNDEIKNSILKLYDPIAVFEFDKEKSENKANSKLILTDEFTNQSKPIVLAININSNIKISNGKKALEVQDIRSIHDRTLIANNGTDLIQKWTQDGLCRYVDEKKITEWSNVARVYFPIDELNSAENKILTKSELVNSHTEVEQRNVALETSEERNMTELKTYHTLKEEDVKNLEIISDEDFSNIVDSIILNDYKNIPNTIRLPNINSELAEKLGLEKDSAFIMKKSATHIRPDRKGSYNQALDTEEYRMIPKVMRDATFALVDKRVKNFQILFDDKNDIKKINKIVFNKDELGNYLVTIGKVGRQNSISEKENIVVGVGVAPTISDLRFPKGQPATRLRPSPTTVNSNIAQNKEMSTEKQTLPPHIKTLNSLIEQSIKEEKISAGKTQDDETKQKKQIPPNLTKKAASDFLRAVQEGTAPFFSMQNDDFGKITMTPQLIVNAQTGLPFKDETQLLAQIYSAEQDMNGQIVTSMEGAKEAGTYIKKCDEAMKNFVLVNQQHLSGENKVMPTRYFSPEAAENPDMVYANVLHKNRPAKIKSFRKLCLHFERLPEGQKDIQVILTKIAWEHLKELQRELKLPDGWKTENLTEKDIIEKKEYIKNYFEKVPARERTVFQETFGICTDIKKEYGDPAFSDKTRKIMDDKLTQFIKDNSFSAEYLAAFTKEEYDKLEDWKKEKGRRNKIEAVGIKEPEVYLGRYLAACNSHAEFITDAETIKVIKEKLSTKLKQNYKLEKYDILKEIGMQAGNICKETMKQNVFSKAHSHDKKQELTIQKDKQHPPVGMGASK